MNKLAKKGSILIKKDTQFSEDESSQQFIGQRFGIKPFSSPNIQLNKMASEHVLNTDKVPKRNH